jgi:hypothetical protein
MSTPTDLLNVERSELGYEEGPKNNQTKFGQWYGFDLQPWCCMFQSWACAQVGAAGFRFAAVATAVAWAKKEGVWRPHASPGYMACRLYSPTKGHIGNVESLIPGDLVDTIEGNTSVGNDREGRRVARRRRSSSFWNAGYVEVPGIDYSGGPLPRPDHAPDGNPYTPLVVDGDFGPRTIRALQWSLNHTGAAPPLNVDGDFGRRSRQALQARLNHVAGPVAIDDQIGPATVRALQRHVGSPQDGVWGSVTTGALQRALNAGTF